MNIYKSLKRSLLAVLFVATPVSADALWIDVRSPAEYAADSIPDDLNIPHNLIAEKITDVVPDKSTKIRLYCRSGYRAGIAKNTLEQLGYTDVVNTGSIGKTRVLRGLN